MSQKTLFIFGLVLILGIVIYLILSTNEEKKDEQKEEKTAESYSDEADYYIRLWEPPKEPKLPSVSDNKIVTSNYIISISANGVDYKVEWIKIDYAFKAGEHIANKIAIASNYNEVIRLTRIALQEMFPEIRVEPDEEILYAFAYKIWGIHEAYKQAGVYSFYVAVEYKDAIVQLIERRFREDVSTDPDFIKKEWAPYRVKLPDFPAL